MFIDCCNEGIAAVFGMIISQRHKQPAFMYRLEKSRKLNAEAAALNQVAAAIDKKR